MFSLGRKELPQLEVKKEKKERGGKKSVVKAKPKAVFELTREPNQLSITEVIKSKKSTP